MTEVTIAEKVLHVKPATKNYDKAVCNGPVPNFEEKHYLAPGSIPKGASTLKVTYTAILKD